MPALPTDATRLADADGWWIRARCWCGRLSLLPCRMLARELHADRTVGDVAARLRCRECGQPPAEAELVDNPQAGAPGYVGSAKAKRAPLFD